MKTSKLKKPGVRLNKDQKHLLMRGLELRVEWLWRLRNGRIGAAKTELKESVKLIRALQLTKSNDAAFWRGVRRRNPRFKAL